MTAARRSPLLAAAALALWCLPARAGNELDAIQKEFKAALEKGTPATVVVVAQGGVRGCSGVMISPKGLVLSDFDAGLVVKARGHGTPDYTDAVRVRVPDLKSGAFVEYEGRIVKVLKDVDSTLIQIAKPPSGGFKYLAPATADALHVGSFTFVAGNSFGQSTESLPAMTAGVLAAVTYRPRGDAQDSGRFDLLYTGAAVTPGVQGGPLLDVEGRLVGVISGQEPVTPDGPYQFLGKAVPIDRLRAAYAGCPEAKGAFPEKPAKSDPSRVPETTALETVVAGAGAAAYPSVASLVVERSAPIDATVEGEKDFVQMPRYAGPASAVVVSSDGWLVTSLYNLTNVLEMDLGVWTPGKARVAEGLAAITKVTAEFPDGTAGDAKVVSWHAGLGIALLKADVVGRKPLEPAPASAYEPGRFVVAVANPFGAKPQPEPFLNFGVVSKRHGDATPDAWRGELQTDVGGTDGNCGAAVVDVEGRLVGLLTLWNPMRHGRNSGVAFILPWDRIEAVLLSMKEGRSYLFPRLGIQWPQDAKQRVDVLAPAKVDLVAKDGPAEKAGFQAGDVVVKIGANAVESIYEFSRAMLGRVAGERVTFVVARAGKEVPLDVELGTRE